MLGGHWTSQKALPTDLKLTYYQQCIPQLRKNGEKLWGMVLSTPEEKKAPCKYFFRITAPQIQCSKFGAQT